LVYIYRRIGQLGYVSETSSRRTATFTVSFYV